MTTSDDRRRAPRLRLTFAVGGLLTGLIGISADAKTFRVDTTVDEVDTNPGDGICATASMECSLRAAVNESNASQGSDRIRLPAGVYALTIPPGDTDTSQAGSLDIDDRLKIVGSDTDTTVVDANQLDHAFSVGRVDFNADPRTRLTLRRLTVRNGDAVNGLGGAIVNYGRTVRLSEVTLRDNHAALGGAIDNFGGDVLIKKSRILDNTGGTCCGAIRNVDGSARLRIARSELRGNSVVASGGPAGGIGVLSGSEVLIHSSTIAGNVSPWCGGAMSIEGENVRIVRSTILDNQAGYCGGGIYQAPGAAGPVVVQRSEIAGNQAPTGPDCTGALRLDASTVIGDPAGCSVTVR